MATRRITASVRDKIRELSEALSEFLPLTARSKNTVTFTTILSDSHVAKYLSDAPKKKALQQALEQVFRKHPRLPSMLIRKIVPAGIAYRKHMRRPLKQAELETVSRCLCELGVDMRKELGQITLDDTLPTIKVPPPELVRRLENHPLVPQIAGEPLELFRNGHFNEAVRKAAEQFETDTKHKAKLNDIGKTLMSRAFNVQSPAIKVNALRTDNEKCIQEGCQFMSMGMILAIRNVFSHGSEAQRHPEQAFEMLMFINWLYCTTQLAKP